MPEFSKNFCLRGLPRLFFSVSIVVSPLSLFRRKPINYDRCAVFFSGLGVSPTSIWYFRSLCGAKYNACYFCCAMAHISRLWDLHITQAFDAPSANLELCDFNLRRFGRRSYSLTLLRDALNIIISKIVNWYGAVIAQSGRQFDESGDCFFGGGMV
jgi:hypothetical protein